MADNWTQMGTGERGAPVRKKSVDYDVAVAGGGMAGMCAAVSAARNGARVVLIQDRSVLGGNASSEIRVHVNGVNHLAPNAMPERETGVIEEILLLNRFQNPQESYPVWDHVLYDYVTREPGVDLMLNTQAIAANMDGDRIASARCWQATTETEFTISARTFIDCSGDGLLAATAGALYRTGREASSEFDEKYAPKEADGWQMGSSLILQGKDMGRPTPYEPPSYALKYDAEKAHDRKITNYTDGYWWVELGSDDDIIGEQEEIRHKLMGYLHGVWDYIKNSGDHPDSANYALDWVGSYAGPRESRRFTGDFILSEKDLTEHRHFDDCVAYGGWSLDEHCPGGIENLSDPPSFFHERFRKVYEIPFRSLYSKNVPNLLFAGRNVSQTHIALSSTRVQATCSTMGQAVGTAAALCLKKDITPRQLATDHINDLQEQLLRDDAFIPNRPSELPGDIAKKADRITASSTTSGDAKHLVDGMGRDFNGREHHWQSKGLPADVTFEWDAPVAISAVEVKCDTNVKRNILMRKDSRVSETFTNTIPAELLRAIELQANVNGEWAPLESKDKNQTRLIKFRFDEIKTTAIRLKITKTYGADVAKLFEVRAYEA